MGIRNLTPLLRRFAPSSFETKSLVDYRDKVLVFDMSIYLYKIFFTDSGVHSHISKYRSFLSFLGRNCLNPKLIFDGKNRSITKSMELEKRREKRTKLTFEQNVFHEQFDRLGMIRMGLENQIANNSSKLVLTNLGKLINVVSKVYEQNQSERSLLSRSLAKELELYKEIKAWKNNKDLKSEKVCARLTEHSRINIDMARTSDVSVYGAYATVSEDLDVLAFGGNKLIRYFGTGIQTLLEIDRNRAQKELGLNYMQFLDLCILCGTDFTGKIPRVGPITALKFKPGF
ncbi:hypothetical protein BB558_003286 [Smittium angustum]|uniref:XPG N-terminal domain-containing protein n=1 Tax=Smittium angustum TaxID=133377 RepID=A0A2U1J6F3_SMIAN|nr:hypothetical protein BB558_003286 [Smittium angustum]